MSGRAARASRRAGEPSRRRATGSRRGAPRGKSHGRRLVEGIGSLALVAVVITSSGAKFFAFLASDHGVGPGISILTEEGWGWLGAIAYDQFGRPEFSNKMVDGEVINPLLTQVDEDLAAVVSELMDDELMPAWLAGCDCGLCEQCLRRQARGGRAAQGQSAA